MTVPFAPAATDTWSTAPSAANWNSANWTGGNAPPQAGDALQFGTSTVTTLNNDFVALTPFYGLTFLSGGSSYTLNGNNVLISGSVSNNAVGVLNSSGITQTLGTLPLTLDRGYYTFSSPSGGTIALNGGLTVNPGGVAYFDANNTSTSLALDANTGLITGLEGAGLIYDGNFTPTGLATISGGNIVAYPSGSYVALASGTIPSGATNNLNLTASGSAITYSSPANPFANTISVAQVGNAGGSATTTLSIPVTSTLTLGASGGIYVLNSAALSKSSFTLSGGPVTAGTAGPATMVIAVNGTTSSNQAQIASAIVDNASGAVSVITTGPGSVLFGTSTSNNYTGGTYVNQGQLQVGKTNGAGFGPIYVASNATIYFQNAGIYPNNSFYLSPGYGSPTAAAVANGGALIYAGTVTNGGVINLLGAPVSAAPGVRVTPNGSSTIVFTNQITGTGTLEINAVSTFSDYIEIRNQTASPNNWQGGLIIDPSSTSATVSVREGANNQMPNGANAGNVTIIAPGNAAGKTVRFDLNGHNGTINGLNAPNNGNTINEQVGNFQGSGPSILSLGGGNASGAFYGEMSDQGGTKTFSLIKIGTGTQTLGGVNTYIGSTTISNGTLALTGSGSIATSPTINISSTGILDATGTGSGGITIGSTQTVNGIGTINGTTVVNGKINPLAGTIGTLSNNGNLTVGSGAIYNWNINMAGGTAGADPGWSQVNVTGGLTISGPFTINLNSLTLADAPGAVADFNSAQSYTWSIAHTTGGISGFTAGIATVSTAGFSNSLGVGKFIVTTNATDILLSFVAPPAITNIHVNLAGSTVAISGTNGPPSVNYSVVSSTNAATALTNWTQVGAGTVGGNGSFTFNGSINPADARRFYAIVIP